MPQDTDLFIDDEFAPLDTRENPESFAASLSRIADEENIEIPQEATPAQPVVVEEAVPQPTTPQPEVMDAGEGATVTITKTNAGWEAVLDANTGARPEVYKGKTQKEVLQQALIGKVHATRKINQLNKQVKLSVPQVLPAPSTVQAQVEQVAGRQLTADEMFAFNTDFKANPAEAMEKWFAKRFGNTPEKLEQAVKTTEETNVRSLQVLEAQEAKEFLIERPDYYSVDDNYHNLLKYIVNQKNADDTAKRFLSAGDYGRLSAYLTRTGLFTSENLSEAYDELTEAGLLQVAEPEAASAPQPTPAVQAAPPPAPAQPAPASRIGTRARTTNAAYGLHGIGRNTAVPTTEQAPSDDELENQSDDEIEKLFNATRRYVAQTRR